MSKTLALFAVICTILPIYGQEKTSHPDEQKNDSSESKQAQVSPIGSYTPVVITVTNQNESKSEAQNPKENPRGYFHELFSPNNLPNIGLMVIGGFGIFFAWSTVKATRNAAEAALVNSKAYINSERPWLLVRWRKHERVAGLFIIEVENQGRTPARMISESHGGPVFFKEGSNFPVEPTYGMVTPFNPPTILIAREKTEVMEFTELNIRQICGSEQHFKRVGGWQDKVFIYGTVHYQDLLDPTNPSLCETGWCFRYIPNRRGGRLVKDGTAKYNQHT